MSLLRCAQFGRHREEGWDRWKAVCTNGNVLGSRRVEIETHASLKLLGFSGDMSLDMNDGARVAKSRTLGRRGDRRWRFPWSFLGRFGLLALALGIGAPAAAGSTGVAFDPWDGVDLNGRIPKADQPQDIFHPERWRYVPEGRIKPGNVIERFMVSSFIAPFFFNDTDVGFGGGIALTDIDFRTKRRREFAGVFLSHSVEGQQNYTGVWRRFLHHREAPGGGVFLEERSYLHASGGYERSLTRRFFGFGDDTDEDDETSYTDQTAFGRMGFALAMPEPGSDIVVGAALRGEWHNLSSGYVGGKPDTKAVYPGTFERADNRGLGWLETEIRYDTRDSQRLPYRGFEVGGRINSALIQSGWDIGAIFTIFGSKVIPVPPLLHEGGDGDEENPPTDTLAFHLETRTLVGDLPFYSVPSLGGFRTLRGFIAGRFRDDSTWHGSAEYRFWVLPRGFAIPYTEALRVERVGLALFADAGSVRNQWWDLFSARVHASAGVGLRVTLERIAPFRVDVGFSNEDVEVTARFGLSF